MIIVKIVMTIIPSKKAFLCKNWEGEQRWRRSELENFANELKLELYTEDTNRDIFERILIHMIKQNEKDEIINNPKYSKLYVKFIEQLPNIEVLQKNWNEEIDYEFFINHNIENFFLQNKPSFDFLEYFLENQIYNIKSDNFIPQTTKYIFFHPDGKYTIM